jgi:hypothetical protein
MVLQKIAVKVFAETGNEIPLTDFIDIFHGWIQASDGVYHDVADYSHMQEGAGIVLVAKDANVSIDETGNRRGLLYNQKAHLDGSNHEKIHKVFRSAFENCLRLEREPSLQGKLKFSKDELVFFINDRLVAPNTDETLATLRPDLERVVRDLVGDATLTLEQNPDRRQRFSVMIHASKPLKWDKLSADAGDGSQAVDA